MINSICEILAEALYPLNFVDAACVFIICEKLLKMFVFIGKKIYERIV